MLFLICAWTKCWANHQHAGDLRRHCAHYDITVMCSRKWDSNAVLTRCLAERRQDVTWKFICRIIHLSREKIATIAHMVFSNAFPWMFFFYSEWSFTEICSLWSNYDNVVSNNGLSPNRHQAIIWSNVVMFHWCIYASLDFNEIRDAGWEMSLLDRSSKLKTNTLHRWIQFYCIVIPI